MFTIKDKVKIVLEETAYCPETGHLFWSKKRSGRRKGPIGNNKGDYIQLYITNLGKSFTIYAHVAAYIHITKEYPSSPIDHINRNGTDNRWVNLRPSTNSQNSMNRGRRENISGYKGVSRNGLKWVARVTKDRVTTYLGTFESKKEASKAYKEASKRLFGEFYNES